MIKKYSPGIYVLNSTSSTLEFEYTLDNITYRLASRESITLLCKNVLHVIDHANLQVSKIGQISDQIITTGYNPN